MNSWLFHITISAALAVPVEIAARYFRLWVYTPPWKVLVNVLITVALIYGTLAWLTAGLSLPTQFMCGAGIGIAYEILNFSILNSWYFPEDKCSFLKGKPALVVGVGLAWGVYPTLTNLLIGVMVRQGH